MSKFISRITKTVAAIGLVAAAASSHALVLNSEADFQGTGLGAVNTVLTLTSPRNTSNEAGSVAWNGTTSVITGDALRGNSQTGTPTLGSIGVESASSLFVVLNATEPQNADSSGITVNNLALTIFSPTGETLFTSDAFTTPVVLDETQAGIGNSGFVFELTAAEISRAARAFGDGFEDNVIGLSASLSNATGGPDSFFVVNFRNGDGGGNGGGGGGGAGGEVPEPGTVAMFGIGLAALGLMRRRKQG